MSGLIWIQTVCQSYQQIALVGNELKGLKREAEFTHCLQITFANSLFVRPDLDPNCLLKLSADSISNNELKGLKREVELTHCLLSVICC